MRGMRIAGIRRMSVLTGDGALIGVMVDGRCARRRGRSDLRCVQDGSQRAAAGAASKRRLRVDFERVC
jgi:hypothetical protein